MPYMVVYFHQPWPSHRFEAKVHDDSHGRMSDHRCKTTQKVSPMSSLLERIDNEQNEWDRSEQEYEHTGCDVALKLRGYY